MKFGINTLLWTSHVTEEHASLFRDIKKAGYDGVEIAMFEGTPDHYARIAIATPDVVHTRLLRHHDRAWRLFWPRLRLVMLPRLPTLPQWMPGYLMLVYRRPLRQP